MNELFEIWNLRTHPFRPEADAAGAPFDSSVWEAALNPIKDPRLVSFYYDLYDWEKSALIRRLRPDQFFESFPPRTKIADSGSVMVLIAGSDSSGRESLQNLILHKIEAQYAEPPLIVRVVLGKNPLENLKKIRTLFPFLYSKEQKRPTRQQLDSEAERAATPQGELSGSILEAVFQIWRTLVSAECARPLVLLATGGDDYDLWQKLYYSSSQLFDFIIVLTKSEVNAESCDSALRRRDRNSSVIKTKQLEFTVAKHYLESRLATQRIGPPNLPPLAPFADDVLNALYEPGVTAGSGDVVRWSVGWLNRTLGRALDEHLEKLAGRQKAGVAIRNLSPAELLIDAAAIRAVREKINQGN